MNATSKKSAVRECILSYFELFRQIGKMHFLTNLSTKITGPFIVESRKICRSFFPNSIVRESMHLMVNDEFSVTVLQCGVKENLPSFFFSNSKVNESMFPRLMFDISASRFFETYWLDSWVRFSRFPFSTYNVIPASLSLSLSCLMLSSA